MRDYHVVSKLIFLGINHDNKAIISCKNVSGIVKNKHIQNGRMDLFITIIELLSVIHSN